MYTLSFDISQKNKKSNQKKYLNHVFRDGTKTHSNENIDVTRTHKNLNLYQDEDGQFRKVESIEQVENSINSRIDLVKKHQNRKMRSDAVLTRGLIIQLDSDLPKSEQIQGLKDSLSWIANEFGRDNIRALSIHNDETNPHMHVVMTPVTDDFRLSQKDFFRDPKDLRRMHDELREYMNSKGYEISKERISGIRNRLSTDEYKEFKKQENNYETLKFKTKNAKKKNEKLKDENEELKNENEKLKDANVEILRLLELKQNELNIYNDPNYKKIKPKIKEIIENTDVEYNGQTMKIEDAILQSSKRRTKRVKDEINRLNSSNSYVNYAQTDTEYTKY